MIKLNPKAVALIKVLKITEKDIEKAVLDGAKNLRRSSGKSQGWLR